jgi:hypothetical protein
MQERGDKTSNGVHQGMTAPRLVLVPSSADWSPESLQTLALALQDMGLAGPELSPGYLAAGGHFLDYLSFLGCAPTVVFEPPSFDAIGSGRFYHISISSPLSRQVFRCDNLTYRPRCPQCKSELNEWRSWWGEGSCAEHPCPGCGEVVSPLTINWRRRAGCGRIFIDILGIHAETVKPVPRLFEELERRTGVAWQYFFVEDEGPLL